MAHERQKKQRKDESIEEAAKRQRLKETPGKKTGKRGVGPAMEVTSEKPGPEIVEDFLDGQEPKPVVPGSKADKGEAEPLVLTPPDEETEEEETIEVSEVKPELGVLCNFVRAVLIRDKKSETRNIALHFSAVLSEEGAAQFSDAIEKRYAMMLNDEGLHDLNITDIPLQTLDLSGALDNKRVLHEVVAPSKVGLAIVQQSGSGQNDTGIRLTLVIPVKQQLDTLTWAAQNHGLLCWLKLGDVQRKLK